MVFLCSAVACDTGLLGNLEKRVCSLCAPLLISHFSPCRYPLRIWLEMEIEPLHVRKLHSTLDMQKHVNLIEARKLFRDWVELNLAFEISTGAESRMLGEHKLDRTTSFTRAWYNPSPGISGEWQRLVGRPGTSAIL
jgi:hypothetical protein